MAKKRRNPKKNATNIKRGIEWLQKAKQEWMNI